MTTTVETIRLTGEKEDLLASFAAAERFVARVRSNPAITGIRVVSDMGEAYVEATNLNSSFRTHLWGTFDADQVDVIVSPRIVKALQSVPAGAVSLTFDSTCEVRGKGKSRYQVGIVTGDWPKVDTGADVEWDARPILDASEVMEAMEVAAKFASRNEMQPTITGVNVRADGDKVRVAATDNHRLFTTRVDPNEFWSDDEDITVPHSMIADLAKLFPAGEIKLSATDNMFFVSAPQGGTYFSCRRLGGKFPEVGRLFPKEEEFKWDVKVPRVELRDAFKRIRFMADAKPVKLQIEDDELQITVQGEGLAEEYVDLPQEHKKIAVGFQLDQVASILEIFKGDEIRLRLISPLKPVMVTAEGEEAEALMMPVRTA